MPWARFDDRTYEHPKFAECGELAPLAGWLWFSAICYASGHLTNGFIPKDQLRRLWPYARLSIEIGGVPDLFGVSQDVTVELLAESLVKVKLFELRDGGYLVHDYLDYNPSKKDILALRRAKQEAGKRGGMASGRTRARPQAAAQHGGSEAPNSPTPTPTPKKELTTSVHRPPGENGFDRFWHAYPRKVGKGACRRLWARLKPDGALVERMLAAVDQQKRSEQWGKDHGAFIPLPATWLGQTRWEDEPYKGLWPREEMQ